MTPTGSRIRLPQLDDARKGAKTTAKKTADEAALARAAGPYLTEPETVEIGWYTTKHPRPWMRWVKMNPVIAQLLLDEYNGDNRPLRPRTVEHYKNIILSGQWHLTHQGAAMDTRGLLQDGQHRLQAIVEAGDHLGDLEVGMAFTVGMPEENFKAIDEGLLRSAADLFAKDGVTYGNQIQSMIRLIRAFEDVNPRRMFRLKATNEFIYDTFYGNEEELTMAARFGQTNYRKAYLTPGALGAAYYLLRKKNGPDNKYVEAFFEGLLTGRKAGTRLALDDLDPRAVTRQYFQNLKLNKKRFTGIEALAIIVMAWNNVVNGYRPRFVRFTDDQDIPRITICADRGPNASVCPEILYGEVDEYPEDDA